MLTIIASRTLFRRVNPITLRVEWERLLNQIVSAIPGVVYRVHVGEWVKNEAGHTIKIRIEFEAPRHEYENIIALVRHYGNSAHWCNSPWSVEIPPVTAPSKIPHVRCESRGSRWHVLADRVQITPPEGVDRVTARFIQNGLAQALQEVLA